MKFPYPFSSLPSISIFPLDYCHFLLFLNLTSSRVFVEVVSSTKAADEKEQFCWLSRIRSKFRGCTFSFALCTKVYSSFAGLSPFIFIPELQICRLLTLPNSCGYTLVWFLPTFVCHRWNDACKIQQHHVSRPCWLLKTNYLAYSCCM